MTADQGADERRVAHLLRRNGVGPDSEAPTPRRPITPSRVIPAGAPLPARPPEPDDIPPWRTPPAPPPPPPAPLPPPVVLLGPPPGPIEVIVTLTPEQAPGPTWRERLAAAVRRIGRPWQILGALTLTVTPIPGTGYSAATTWHYTVSLARQDLGVGWGYATGGIPLALALLLVVRRGGTLLRLAALAVTLVGAVGAISWYDPIQLITGVPR
ncbi:hypothetical protein [Streptomyces tremellae]|uniref:Uncharacterized protein n=1 Tax=Streptomyces tremellae TaxID=1124239 RepID=A0ABP7EGC3_9ACTN